MGKYSKMAAWLRMLVCARNCQTSSTANSSSRVSATVAGWSDSQNAFMPVGVVLVQHQPDFGAEERMDHGGPGVQSK